MKLFKTFVRIFEYETLYYHDLSLLLKLYFSRVYTKNKKVLLSLKFTMYVISKREVEEKGLLYPSQVAQTSCYIDILSSG